jgi:tetratricopeptide (TPR) repeat protein
VDKHSKRSIFSSEILSVNEQMEYICFEYSVTAAELIDLRLPYDVIVNWSKTALKIAQKRKDVMGEAIALNNLGTAYSNIGYPDKGIPLLMRSLEVSAGLDDKQRASDRLTNLGNAYRRKKDFEKALEFHFAALKIGEELKDDSVRASIANNIGNVYIEQNDPKNSMHYHQLSLELAKKNGYLITEAASMLALAVAYAMQNKIIKYLQYNNSSVKLARKLGSRRLIEQAAGNSEHIFSQMRLGFIGKWYARKIREGG